LLFSATAGAFPFSFRAGDFALLAIRAETRIRNDTTAAMPYRVSRLKRAAVAGLRDAKNRERGFSGGSS
jgi:hypothetical protein